MPMRIGQGGYDWFRACVVHYAERLFLQSGGSNDLREGKILGEREVQEIDEKNKEKNGREKG